MTYEQLKTKLYKNLTELMRLCDEGKCDKWRVIHYQDYITRTLNTYRLQQGK